MDMDARSIEKQLDIEMERFLLHMKLCFASI
jgi:hypothetical protein